ncbi:MAG: Veg family protein [Lachnospiraceae bacterium]|nr:Veg family protein [Lachnospiraceae bacterium]
MSQADILRVKSSVYQNIGNKVKIRANRGRHKIDETEGIIRETYPSIFLVEVENKLDDTTQKISFSYTDVLTKDVQMQLI